MSSAKVSYLPPVNFAGLNPPYSSIKSARVAVLPVPYDSTTEWHSGTREGPRAIISASPYLEMYDRELDQETYKVGIYTAAEIEPALSGPKDMIQKVQTIAGKLIDKSKLIVMLGGEHSVTLGMVRALKDRFQSFSVLQLDAHADLRDQYMSTKYSHACVMRRVLEVCPITQVGIRSLSLEEQYFIDQNNLKPFFLKDSDKVGLPVQNIVESLNDDVYITIDLDVFDPSILPAVGMPEPGGLQWHDVLNLLKAVALRKNIIGFDLVELCPSQGPNACAFLSAKLVYKMIGYSLLLNKESA